MWHTSRVLAAALRGECRLSTGAAADYGYDPIVYQLQEKSFPDEKNLELLTHLYAEAIELHGDFWLHEQLIKHNLRSSLAALTDKKHTFDWVAFMNE